MTVLALALYASGLCLVLAGWTLQPHWRRPPFPEAALRAAVWPAALALAALGAGRPRRRR